MAHIIDRIRASVGARIITVAIVGIGTAALILAAITFQFVASVTDQAASEATTALRDQGQISLRRLTDEQGQRYDQVFREITHRSEALARRAGRRLTANARNTQRPAPTMRWLADKGFHTNASDAPVSIMHWGNRDIPAGVRDQIDSLDQMSQGLTRTLDNIPEATAAWVITEQRAIAYAPNRPLIDADRSGDDTDIHDRVFYQTAVSGDAQSRQARWTPVYRDPAGQGLMISAVTPIFGPDGGRLLGVAGIDITISGITTRLLTQDPLDLGPDMPTDGLPAEVSFLMDADTTPVAVPADQRSLLGLDDAARVAPGQDLQQAPLVEVCPAGLREAIQSAMAAEGTDTWRFAIADKQYIAAFARIASTDWILTNVIAENALVSGAASARQTIETGIIDTTSTVSLTGAVLILLVAGTLTVYLRSTVVTPLKELTHAAEQIADGQYRTRVPVRGKDELARMSESFNDLSSRLADVMEDLEQRVAARTADLEAARDYFHSILESSPVGIIFIDGERRIRQVNPAFQELVGWETTEVIGTSPEVFYKSPEEARRIGRHAYPVFKSGGTYETVVTLERPDGTEVITSVMGQAVNPEALDEGYIWVLQDITEQKRLEDELARLAAHDHLTGLYNRGRIVEVLEQAAEENHRYKTPFSAILFDIDAFKAVNDTYGHGVGDRVLIELTDCVSNQLRTTDHAGRWGGEEFMIVVGHSHLEGGYHLAERIRHAVASQAFTDVGTVTISLGVAEYDPEETLEHLEERADDALYKAKSGGRNRVCM